MNINKESLITKFTDYVQHFELNDNNIERKYYHSLRVMNFAENIAISEKFNENDIEISIVAGLLHDYARFTQWTNYHTYNDIESIDHGDLGVELLFDKNEIVNFYDNSKNYGVIYDAIKYHNKSFVPDKLSDHENKIAYIIRDADKLDIFNIFIQGGLTLKESKDDISKEIQKSFYENKCINYKDITNDNEDTLLKLAMIYDLKYKYSVKYILENNILDKLYSKIKNKEKFKEYFNYMNNYLNDFLNM